MLFLLIISYLPIFISPAFLGASRTHCQVAEGFLPCCLGTWVAVFLVLKLTPLTQGVEMSDPGVDSKTKEEVSGSTVYPALASQYGENLFVETTR